MSVCVLGGGGEGVWSGCEGAPGGCGGGGCPYAESLQAPPRVVQLPLRTREAKGAATAGFAIDG